jgi:hypothetical protein
MSIVDVSMIGHEQEVIESIVIIPEVEKLPYSYIVSFISSGKPYGRVFPNCPHAMIKQYGYDKCGDFHCNVYHCFCGCISKALCSMHYHNKDEPVDYVERVKRFRSLCSDDQH